MNIFELVASDPNSYQQLASDYTQHNTNWSLFKRNISALFSNEVPEVDQFITRSKELWAHVIRTSPDLISVMIKHYLSKFPSIQTSLNYSSRANSILNSKKLH